MAETLHETSTRPETFLVETRPRRDVDTSRDRLETETSRPRPHPCSEEEEKEEEKGKKSAGVVFVSCANNIANRILCDIHCYA